MQLSALGIACSSMVTVAEILKARKCAARPSQLCRQRCGLHAPLPHPPARRPAAPLLHPALLPPRPAPPRPSLAVEKKVGTMLELLQDEARPRQKPKMEVLLVKSAQVRC